jgi:pimeloyl-ACP methyl ester carboxylesterase
MRAKKRLTPSLCLILLAAAGCGDSDGPSEPVDEGNPPAAGCSDGTLPAGSLYRICFPADWNGELIIFAHGYVRSDEPLRIVDNLLGGFPVSAIATGMGYAFATTSYRDNGLVADVAVDDLVELDERFRETVRPDPTVTYLVGVSEGGLVATLAAEQHPDRFSAALAACGPVGDFATQVDYFGDFRVVFDYFFPGVLPGSAVDVPDELRANWESQYRPAVEQAVAANPDAALQVIEVTGAAVDQAISATVEATITDILWYNVYATGDARDRLDGQPYDNSDRVYQGSDDDAALNAGVARHAADPEARAALGRFDTSGDLEVPVVTLHTTGDPIVPFLHEELYGAKVSAAGAGARLTQQAADRYGHCVFTQLELQAAFGVLIQGVSAVARAPRQ